MSTVPFGILSDRNHQKYQKFDIMERKKYQKFDIIRFM